MTHSNSTHEELLIYKLLCIGRTCLNTQDWLIFTVENCLSLHEDRLMQEVKLKLLESLEIDFETWADFEAICLIIIVLYYISA